jgi:hypothetical protein
MSWSSKTTRPEQTPTAKRAGCEVSANENRSSSSSYIRKEISIKMRGTRIAAIASACLATILAITQKSTRLLT